MNSANSILAHKAELRAAAIEHRDALPPVMRAAAAEVIAARPLPLAVSRATVVSGFMPIRSEINPLPLLRHFAEAGVRLALPTIVKRGEPLRFRAWAIGEKLARGQWGIREPLPEAPEVLPDILLVPLAAFDRRGHRIGYGAGYYDLSLAALRAKKSVIAIGLGFAAQEIPAVPVLPHDARLDLVLTEREVIDLRSAT
jgi:5-formyltetrahydrofolate cyclo-ligase